MVRRVVEYPIAQSQSLCTLEWPDITILEKASPIGGNRETPYECHYIYSCDCYNLDFKEWLEGLGNSEFRLYGCYEWEMFKYRIERKFGGFSIYFPAAPPLFDNSWMKRAAGAKPN